MAPPPEYDKEPKAPDKSATTITNEDSTFLNSIIDQQTKSDHKPTNTVANIESEKSKADDSVENLDDGRLRALLDEAITYKCPKDREGKSDLFKNLLEEAEQDDQASEAAARGCGGGGRARRGAGRRALPHSNSLQDLVAAALAAEPAPRRPRHHAHAPVSARATHGGSLPSGVDTSFLLGEEPARGGYLATVRCVNPPPLAERRVSASDANCPAEVELLHRRSKPVFPMTYTARATLEIGSGSVSSGRAVTTTTASNQVRTSRQPRPTFGPPHRLYAGHSPLYDPAKQDSKQSKLMNALRCPRNKNMSEPSESDLRGPRSDYENFGILWSEITARYSPATTSATGTNQAPKIQTAKPSTSTDPSSSSGNKLVTPSICANPSSQKTLTTRHQSATTYGNDTEKLTHHASPSFGDKTQPASQIKPSNKNTTSSISVVPSIENKIAKPSTNNTSSSENKTTNLLSESRPSSQVNQTIVPIRQTMPFPEKRTIESTHTRTDQKPDRWVDGVDKWYEGLSAYIPKLQNRNENIRPPQRDFYYKNDQNDKSDAPQNTMNDTSEIDIHENRYSTSTHYNKNTNCNASIDVYGTQTHWIAREKKLVKPLSNTIANCENENSYQNLKSSFVYEDDQHGKLNNNLIDTEETDIRLRKKYRNIFGHSLAQPSSSLINPRNVRPMSIGSIPTPVDKTSVSRPKNKKYVKLLDTKNVKNISTVSKLYEQVESMKAENCDNPKDIIPASEAGHSISKCYDRSKIVEMVDFSNNKSLTNVEENCQIIDCTLQQTCDAELIKTFQNPDIKLVEISQSDAEVKKDFNLQDFAESKKRLQVLKKDSNEDNSEETELKELTSNRPHDSNESSFEQYNCEQQHFLRMIKETTENCVTEEEKLCNSNNSVLQKDMKCTQQENDSENGNIETEEPNMIQDNFSSEDTSSSDIVIKLNKKPQDKVSSDQYILAELSNNAYVFLTMPERLFTPLHNTDKPVKIQEISNDVSATVEVQSTNVAPKNSKKKKGVTDAKKKENITKTALKVLLFENIKRDSMKAEASSEANKEADSAIPFSCITTPEVVSSCNTTSSTSQSAVAVDPKPLQLGSYCRAVASLTGDAPVPASASAPAPALAASQSQVPQPQLPVLHNAASAAAPQPTTPQPRSVISSSFNGLSLSRPNYGSTASTAPDEYKKSLDENGNAVQGFSSPISGSSQHKKPRRKKSSKNETVIKSHQIDGYQGNKDLNEVLRFIESNAEHGRGAKLGRAKHDDDKAGKKRSSERRKDKESKLQRASSLEERSRTKLEDLTDAREPPRRHERKPRPDNKAERRSWGDDARDAFYYPAPAPVPPPEPEPDHEPEPEHEPDPPPVPAPATAPPDAAVELTDFQTVTKRRKPRRRADEAEREPPRRPRPPSPRPRRESAPPSDRSNDSNDDLDSVHSLPPPPPPPPPAPHASYADIARTRHNIPDLIESCNFYGEGENAGGRRAADAPAAAGDADGYPALGGAARLARGKAPPRRERKERAAPAAGGECPAPDVVGDRRPAVILLDSAARPRDMDGVTFGFDINEQLLGAGGRRPRCDLVRDALAAAPARASLVPVLAGAACTPLRYLPPDPPTDNAHLHQIIDYVGNAWEDVVRCGGGKVRYFSE